LMTLPYRRYRREIKVPHDCVVKRKPFENFLASLFVILETIVLHTMHTKYWENNAN